MVMIGNEIIPAREADRLSSGDSGGLRAGDWYAAPKDWFGGRLVTFFNLPVSAASRMRSP
jgi:hypothetical protein